MSLESASFIADLVSTNPLGTDKRKLGDDHLRLIKAVLQATFPNASTAFWFPCISAKSADFSITANDDNTTFLVDTTAGNVTISAPAASGLNARFKCRIVKTSSDANKITFDPNGSETVNGAATLNILNQNIPADFYCDATQWFAASGQWFGLTAAEVTVASASTCDILGAASALVAISGATTITSLGTGANRVRFVRFTGALTLTHNATSLILPGGANITTAAGDTMIVESDASSNARVLAYQRADGTAVVAPTSIVSVKKQIFTSSNTYTPTSGMLYALIIALGGGQGGGDYNGTSPGSGGDAASMAWKIVSAADIGVSKSVTIGSAGAHAANGGDTSVGSLCVAPGGGSSTTAVGDIIGQGETGSINYLSGSSNIKTSGRGGSSLFGAGGAEKAASGTGNAASGYGAGGGGSGNSNGNQGGAGSIGVVFIIEFCG